MNSDTSQLSSLPWLLKLLIESLADCGLERPKSTPKAACPITSVANLREKLEKVISSLEDWKFSVADSIYDCMVGTKLAKCDGW